MFKKHTDLEPIVVEGVKKEDMDFVDSVFGYYPNLLFQSFMFHEPQKPDDVFKLMINQSMTWSPSEKASKSPEEAHEMAV